MFLFDLIQCQLICTLLEINNTDIFYENLLSKAADKIGQQNLDKIIELGLLSEEPVIKLGSPLDTFSQFIASKLSLSMYHLYVYRFLFAKMHCYLNMYCIVLR